MPHTLHQFYLNCLAHASYLIASDGEAAIVDPQRDVDQYVDEAARRGLRVRWIIETHLHADFVSGHRELAARTGAEIVIGARAAAAFPHHPARDGDVLRLGSMSLRALETPGHTPESVCWLVVDGDRVEKVLTGDTLFIGDVGRPDLAAGHTPDEMASQLYDSLQRLLTLDDAVEVWPAHGAGSACGKNISKETSSTIGMQRRTNYALAPMAREAFVNMMTSDLSVPPPYFAASVEMNRRGARALSEVVGRALELSEVGDAVLLDVREASAFAAAHPPGAINIGLGGQFASWCGTLLSSADRIVIIADSSAEADEAVMRLARVGFENAAGYVLMADWRGPTESLPQLTPRELASAPLTVLDVRRSGEFASGHIAGAVNVPLHELAARLHDVPAGQPLAVICGGGYRSSMAASLLARAGVRDLHNVVGGMGGWMGAVVR